MAPLGDRNVNRQSRLPTASSSNTPQSRINNENAPPQSGITRLLVPTKSSVARSRSPSPISTQIGPRVSTGAESPFRGRLNDTGSNGSLSASISRQLRRPSPSPVMDALNAHKSGRESPTVPLRNPGRAQSKKTPQKSNPAPVGQPLSSRTGDGAKGQARPISSIKRMTSQGSTASMRRASSSKLPRSPAMLTMDKASAVKTSSPPLHPRPSKVMSPRVTSSRPTSVAAVQSQSSKNELSGRPGRREQTHPPRSSSLRQLEEKAAEIGLGITTDSFSSDSIEGQERRHMPPVNSFSQPRVRNTSHSRPSSPDKISIRESSAYVDSDTAATVSRIPTLDSKKTPKLDSPKFDQMIATREKTPRYPDTNDILTFAGRRLGNASDLAALDQGTARSSKRRASTDKSSFQKKPNLTLKNPSSESSSSDPGKLSPIKFFFGDKSSPTSTEVNEYSRVKHIWGNLSSSSFAGSTLSISEDADRLILGPSEEETSSESVANTPTQRDFDLPSPSSNGFHVSWPADFGFNPNLSPYSPTMQSSPSIRNETMGMLSSTRIPRIVEENEPAQDNSRLDVELTLSVAPQDGSSSTVDKTMRFPVGGLLAAAANDSEDEFLPGATITADDEDAHQHITATLSLLEGTPVKKSRPIDYFNNPHTTAKQEPSGSAAVPEKSQAVELTAPTTFPPEQVTKRSSMAKLSKTTKKMASDDEESPVHSYSDRMPSYMLPTPASEARRLSAAPGADGHRTNTTRGTTPISGDRRTSKIGKLTPTPTPGNRHTSPFLRLTPTSEHHTAAQAERLTPNADVRPTLKFGRRTPSPDTRNAPPTSQPSIKHQKSQRMPKRSTVVSKENDTPKTRQRKRASSMTTKPSRHVSMAQAATDDSSRIYKTQPPSAAEPEISPEQSRPASTVKSSLKLRHSRSESKSKFGLSNIKGLFSSRRDVPPTPAHDGRRSFSARKTSISEPQLPPLTNSRRKSVAKSISSKKNVRMPEGADGEGHEPEQGPSSTSKTPNSEKRQTVALMEMGLTLREEAFKESDVARKERMATFAQVMLDTVTNAVEAERNMYAAMQAAEQAQLSYQMTQRSVVEMSRLISNSRRLPNLFKKTNTTTSAMGLR